MFPVLGAGELGPCPVPRPCPRPAGPCPRPGPCSAAACPRPCPLHLRNQSRVRIAFILSHMDFCIDLPLDGESCSMMVVVLRPLTRSAISDDVLEFCSCITVLTDQYVFDKYLHANSYFYTRSST